MVGRKERINKKKKEEKKIRKWDENEIKEN